MKNRSTFGKIPLLAALPPEELQELTSVFHMVEIPSGEILFREGNRDSRVYILLEGQVEIIKMLGTPEERLLGTRSAGDILGEMSLFSQDLRRTASVRAITPLRLLVSTKDGFTELLTRSPHLTYQMARSLSQRLEQSENVTIFELKQKNQQLSEAYQALQEAQAQLIEQEKLQRELDIAHQIQKSILPQQVPQRKGFDFGALMMPAHAVGGDFYDFIQLKENRLGIVVGDVLDKGVPAALFMGLTYSLLRAEAQRSNSPAKVLQSVNHHLLDMDVSQMFVTIFYGILDCDIGELHYARAGHPMPLVLDGSGRSAGREPSLGQLIGVLDKPVLDENRVKIPPGGAMLIVSDGLSEASSPQGEPFGDHRLEEALRQNLDASSQEICQRLWKIVTDYSASPEPQDDMTLLVIKAVAPMA
jgi:sigma-B regulation protein RsbU (phosphoserine phosphatase)